MKKFSMVVHSSLQQELADLLRSLQLDSFMFSHIEERSAQREDDMLLSARDRVVGYVPKVRVDVILDDERALQLVDEICEAKPSFKGKGLYWVSAVEKSGEM